LDIPSFYLVKSISIQFSIHKRQPSTTEATAAEAAIAAERNPLGLAGLLGKPLDLSGLFGTPFDLGEF
jgi:hypothetical protein